MLTMAGLNSSPLKFYNASAAQALQLLAQLKDHHALSLTDHVKVQTKGIAEILMHAFQYSKFWRSRLVQSGFDEKFPYAFSFNSLSPLTREELQNQFEELRARWPNCETDKIFTVASSGSTGQPVRVEKYGDHYLMLENALALLELDWFARDADKTIAYLGPQVEVDKLLPTWGGIYQALGHKGRYFKRSFSGKTIASHLDWLLEIKPNYFKCSPYLAAQIAELAIETGKQISIDQIISMSESVSPRHRQLCLQAFGAKIVDRYSSEETGMIALQCPHHDHQHVITSAVHVEIVDKAGRACEKGEVGRVLVTVLQSYAMPIIRYDLGDLAEWGQACDVAPNMPVLSKLWGRVRNKVNLPDGSSFPMAFLGDELGHISNIREFRLKQYLGTEIEFELVLSSPLTEFQLRLISAIMKKSGLGPLAIYINSVSEINWVVGRKRHEFEQVNEYWQNKVSTLNVTMLNV